MPLPPYNIYRDQLTSLYHGLALWEPDPGNLYETVSVGDVGYVTEGYFIRMFNVLLPWNHPSNQTCCTPDFYEPVDLGPFLNIRESTFNGGDYCSRHVAAQEHNAGAHRSPDEEPGERSVSYRSRKPGAFLNVPHHGLRRDVVRTKAFEDYIRDHVDSWFSIAQRNRLPVQRMEEIILVSGCTLVNSWAAATFLDSGLDMEISLGTKSLRNGGIDFQWRVEGETSTSVERKNSFQGADPPRQNQCVFVRGFRAKRILFYTTLRRAAAEPLPDDPDNRPEDEIEVTRVPEVPSYRDPLTGVLDYIAEKCPENTIAIAHDNDLEEYIEEVDLLTADAVEGFLRQNEIGVLIENGAALLRDDDETPVPEDEKATFYAQAESEGELIPLIVHPVLAKYLLKIDMNTQPDHEYDLPKEEIHSPAVHPPMLSVTLENHEGYPQPIPVHASNESPDIGITVQDVLKAIIEDVKKASRRREWTKLRLEERAEVDTAFRERCSTEEELGQGPCRIDYLRGRNRIQVFPKVSQDGVIHPLPAVEPVEPLLLDEPNVAGPSRIPIR